MRLRPEYDRVVEETGDRREAEQELAERQKRHDELEIVPLSDAVRTRYAEEWRLVQARSSTNRRPPCAKPTSSSSA